MEDDPAKVLQLLNKFGADSDRAGRECRVASSLSEAFKSIRSSKITAHISSPEGSVLDMFTEKQLKFSSKDSSNDTCLSTLAYLTLRLNHGKELDSLTVAPAAPGPSKKDNGIEELKAELRDVDLGAKNKQKILKTNNNGAKGVKEERNLKIAPPTRPLFSADRKRCFFTLSLNGRFYGKIVIQPRLHDAPIMSAKFIEHCVNKKPPLPRDKVTDLRANKFGDILLKNIW